MAIKRTVHEVCPDCGSVVGTLDYQTLKVSHVGTHKCVRPAPAIPNPPKTWNLREVLFKTAAGAYVTEVDGRIVNATLPLSKPAT